MKRIAKLIILAINILAAILLTVSTLAGAVHPDKSIVPALLGYGYLYLLVANVGFIVLWLFLGSRWFLLSLAVIAVRASFVPMYFQIGGTEEIDKSVAGDRALLKVMSFNAHLFEGEERNHSMVDSNIMLFLKQIDVDSPDVVALQECVGRGKTVNLAEQMAQRGYSFNAATNNSNMSGTAIYSKLPLCNTFVLKSPSTCVADLPWNGDTVRIYSLHFDSYRLDDNDRETINKLSHGTVDTSSSRSTLKKISSTIRTHSKEWQNIDSLLDGSRHPCVLMGDFNDPPASYLYQQSTKKLTDSYCEVGQGFSTTYHGAFTRRANTVFPAFRIDLILHSGELEALSYKRIKTSISDHYPVMATLSTQKAACND